MRDTWVARAKEVGTPCYFVEGDYPSFKVIDDVIAVPEGDGFIDTYDKTYAGLSYLFNELGCSIVFRTNLSSYIDVDALHLFVERKAFDESIYAGVIGKVRYFSKRLDMKSDH